jgi:hypothetical protein
MGESAQVALDGEPETVDRPIVYDPVFDEFRMAGAATPSPPLGRCPWCDRAFGPSRRDAWFERLEQLGLSPDDDLPPELLSDHWWSDTVRGES